MRKVKLKKKSPAFMVCAPKQGDSRESAQPWKAQDDTAQSLFTRYPIYRHHRYCEAGICPFSSLAEQEMGAVLQLYSFMNVKVPKDVTIYEELGNTKHSSTHCIITFTSNASLPHTITKAKPLRSLNTPLKC